MFTLHPTLAKDSLEITRWDVSQVRLINDVTYPWLILVPVRDNLSGLHELAQADRLEMMEEIVRASNALKKLYDPARINVAALGNVVEQLHIHIIARFENDAAWPGPVWGVKPAQPYAREALESTVQKLQKALRI